MKASETRGRGTEMPGVSIVVATHNRAHLLDRLVDAIAAQTAAIPFELVVVDDASIDDTPAALTRLGSAVPFPFVSVRLDSGRGPGGARNAGWHRARASLVVFTDDDCEPQPGWLAALLDGFTEADVVQGRTRPAPDQLDRHGAFGRTISVDAENGYFQTCNVAYRRDVLEAIGGFDEAFRLVGEDTDLAHRAIAAGARTTFRADAVVHHDVRPSDWWVHVRTSWRWRGLPLVVRRHPELRRRLVARVFWKPSHPRALAAATGLLVALTSRRPRAVVTGAAMCLPYVNYRMSRAPLAPRRRQRAALLPAALAADLNEVGVLVVGSVEHRSLML